MRIRYPGRRARPLILALVLLAGFLAVCAVAEAQQVTAGPVTRQQVVGWILAYSARYGVDPGWMLAVAECESGLDPWAVGRFGEVGPFQIRPPWAGPGIWASLPEAAEGSPADPELNVKAAVHAHALGLGSAWLCG